MSLVGITQECTKVNKSVTVNCFDDQSGLLAGSPAFIKLSKGCEEEGLLGEAGLCLHDLSSVSITFYYFLYLNLKLRRAVSVATCSCSLSFSLFSFL